MRIKQQWMSLEQDEIDSMEEDDWEHYSNGGCVCFARCSADCICGSWWRE